MRLLLKKPVEALGEPGDEVNVKPGYARNFLLPRGFATFITERARREADQARREWAVQKVRDRDAAKALGEAVSGLSLRFERRVKTGTDELYGSVSVQDIARELREAGFDIARNRVIMGKPIKTLGPTDVRVRLHAEVEVTLPVEVEAARVSSLGVIQPEVPGAPDDSGTVTESVESGQIEPEEAAGTPPAD